jgi:hypothetical protein
MPSQGEMYPGTDYPKYIEVFESVEELIKQVESLDEGLNFIVSWAIGCYECDYVENPKMAKLHWEKGEKNYFHLLIFMPRRTETTNFQVQLEAVPHALIDNWLEDYVRLRVMRWYGWTDDAG